MKKFINFIAILFYLPYSKADSLSLQKDLELKKIFLPGENVIFKNNILTYNEMLDLIEKFGEKHEKGRQLTIQTEESSIDFTFLDDIGITISTRQRDGAPPNAGSAF